MGWRMLLARPDARLGLRALAGTEWALQCWQCLVGFTVTPGHSRRTDGFVERWHVPQGQRAKRGTSRGVQQSQTAPIQGSERAPSTEPARLGLKQEMFLQSDKITSDPEKLPLFPSAEMPGRGAGHLMNYETLGNERLCRQVLNISFPLAWLLPARGSGLGGVQGRSALSQTQHRGIFPIIRSLADELARGPRAELGSAEAHKSG